MNSKKGFIKLASTSFVIYPLSFINQLLLSYHFGASSEMDSFWIALTGINALTLFSGPMKDALVPHYFGQKEDHPQNAHRYISERLNLILLLSLFSFILALIFSEQIASLLVDHNQQMMIAPVSRLLLLLSPAIFLIPLTQALEGILLGFKRYYTQMLGRLLGTLGSIAVLLLLVNQLGINALVVGNVGALCVFLLWQSRESSKQNLHYRLFTLPKADWSYIKLVLSMLAMFFFAQAYALFENRVFTSFGPGLVSSYRYGMSLTQMPQNILVVALTAILWPKLIEKRSTKKLDHVFQLTFTSSKQLALALTVVSLIGWVFAEPLIRLIYFRGAFSEEDVQTTVLCFKSLTLSIVPFGIMNVFNRVLSSLMLPRALFWAGLSHALAGSACLLIGQKIHRIDVAAAHLLAATSLNVLVSIYFVYKATGTDFIRSHIQQSAWWLCRLAFISVAFLTLFPLQKIQGASKFALALSLGSQALLGLSILIILSLLTRLVALEDITVFFLPSKQP